MNFRSFLWHLLDEVRHKNVRRKRCFYFEKKVKKVFFHLFHILKISTLFLLIYLHSFFLLSFYFIIFIHLIFCPSFSILIINSGTKPKTSLFFSLCSTLVFVLLVSLSLSPYHSFYTPLLSLSRLVIDLIIFYLFPYHIFLSFFVLTCFNR